MNLLYESNGRIVNRDNDSVALASERMNGTKYQIRLDWSPDDGVFLAEVPELPGCIADGETYEQALKNVKVAIDEWIATANEIGRSIPLARNSAHFHPIARTPASIKHEIRSLTTADQKALRNWLDHLLENDQAFTEDFDARIARGEQDLREGRVRIRKP